MNHRSFISLENNAKFFVYKRNWEIVFHEKSGNKQTHEFFHTLFPLNISGNMFALCFLLKEMFTGL